MFKIKSLFKEDVNEPGELLGTFDLIDPKILTYREFLRLMRPSLKDAKYLLIGLVSFFLYDCIENWNEGAEFSSSILNSFKVFGILFGIPLLVIILMTIVTFIRKRRVRATFYSKEIHYNGKKIRINTFDPVLRFSPTHLLIRSGPFEMVRLVHTNSNILDYLEDKYQALSASPKEKDRRKIKYLILLLLVMAFVFLYRN